MTNQQTKYHYKDNLKKSFKINNKIKRFKINKVNNLFIMKNKMIKLMNLFHKKSKEKWYLFFIILIKDMLIYNIIKKLRIDIECSDY